MVSGILSTVTRRERQNITHYDGLEENGAATRRGAGKIQPIKTPPVTNLLQLSPSFTVAAPPNTDFPLL